MMDNRKTSYRRMRASISNADLDEAQQIAANVIAACEGVSVTKKKTGATHVGVLVKGKHKIAVRAKKGETAADAMKRVSNKHPTYKPLEGRK